MRRIFKRLEALEGAADRKLLSDNFAMDVAVAYYLGGARHESELTQASATALGYKNVTEFCKAFAQVFTQPETIKPGGIWRRTRRARCKLLVKFGHDMRRTSPADLADAYYRIVRTLPEEWRAMIKSAHREWYELEAKTEPTLKELMQKVEEGKHNNRRRARTRGRD
jgi:hypothetical protein